MAVKSLKIKLFFNKTDLENKKNVWFTHQIFNEAVAYYTKQLLLLRQIPTYEHADPKADLLRNARAAQSANGKSKVGTDEEVLKALRELYEAVIPASIGKSSNAQISARAFLSPLVDQKSKAGLGLLPKRNPANVDAGGTPVLLEAKARLSVLPLFKAFSDTRPWRKTSVCTTWDRDAFQQAIERLSSWEAWNLRVKEENAALDQKFEEMSGFLRTGQWPPKWLVAVRQYETERKLELNLTALASDNPYRILKSGIRGWKALRERWRSAENKSTDSLLEILTEVQAERRGEFGDPDVFQWLAREKNHFIWDQDDDVLSLHVALNEIIAKKERSKQEATLTLPDPIDHPVWTRFDGPAGSIQKYSLEKTDNGFRLNLSVLSILNGEIRESIVPITVARSQQLARFQIRSYNDVPEALRAKIEKQKNDNEIQWIRWEDPGTKHVFYGKLGGGKLNYARTILEKRKSFNAAYFSVTITLIPLVDSELSRSFTVFKPDETSGWTIVDFKPELLPQWVSDKRAANGIAGLRDGLRIMSVSPKVNSLAVCSVFELTTTPEEGSYAFPVKDTNLYAVHRRSFKAYLPGDKVSNKIQTRRMAITRERLEMRAKLRRITRILSLAAKEKREEREEFIKLLKKTDFSEDTLLLDQALKVVDSDIEAWKTHILKIHRELEHDFGREFSAWRVKYRKKTKANRAIGGISIWWINELNEVRRLMNAWSAHSRFPRELVRQRCLIGERKDKNAREVDLDRRLLQHVTNIKEDRIKKSADALVMSALGYQYQGKKQRWVAKHAPCRVIIFQDLSDYRFDRAHGRKTNARLMAWAHRSLPKYTAHQGEIYGVIPGILRGTSLHQIHARTQQPALRMLHVNEQHLDSMSFARDFLRQLVQNKEISVRERKDILASDKKDRVKALQKYVRIGDRIPWESGELLVTMGSAGETSCDVNFNSVQNLQRLFWTKHSTPIRLVCIGSDEFGFAPVGIGKRLEAALGYGRLVPNVDEEDRQSNEGEYRWEPLPKRKWSKLVGSESTNEEVEQNDSDTERVDVDAGYNGNPYVTNPDFKGTLPRRVKRTFFRDLSGVFFPKDIWVVADTFWKEIEKVLTKKLSDYNSR